MKSPSYKVVAVIAVASICVIVWFGSEFFRSGDDGARPSPANEHIEKRGPKKIPLAEEKQLIATLTKKDPRAAVAYVTEIPEGQRRRRLVETITGKIKLGKAEPLILFLDSSKDSHEHNQIWRLSNRFGRAFEPRWALKLREKCSNEEVRLHLLAHAAKQSLRTGNEEDPINVEQSLAWLVQQERSLQPELRQEITRVLSRLEPQSALDLMGQDPRFKPVPEHGARIAHDLGSKGAGVAADWIVGMSRELKQPAMISIFVVAWLKQDSLEASKWVDELKGPERQAAIWALVEFLKESGDREAARIWAAQLEKSIGEEMSNDK